MVNRQIAVLRLVGGIFTGVGLLLLAFGGWVGNRQYTILKHWPTVNALVTRSQVTHHESTSQNSRTTMYQAEIEFHYTVNGKEYTTPSASPYSTSSYAEMKRKVDAYAPGTTYSIRYNPADANDIRFDVGFNFGFFFLPALLGGIGVVFFLVGGGLLMGSRKARNLVCPTCGQGVEAGQKYCPNCAAPLPSDLPIA
jgi:hypothetical protein